MAQPPTVRAAKPAVVDKQRKDDRRNSLRFTER